MWIASKTRSFTIQSAIQILQLSTPMSGVQWEWLWKLRLPYRIQIFLWLLFHRTLLTSVERFRRRLSTDSQCEVCLEGEEDLDHLLRQCPNALDVWHVIHSIGLCGAAADTSLKEWLLANLTDIHVDPNWPTKFAITLWYIWKWRCSMCLGSTELIPMDKGTFLYHKF